MRSFKPNYLACMIIALSIVLSSCNLPSNLPTLSPTSADPPTAAPPSPTPKPQGVSPVSLPASRLDHAGDVDSSVDATKKRVPGGDQFVQGLYERPFNANSMDTYFPYIDIIDTQGFKDDTWGYATITLFSTDSNGKLPATYGVEVDTNKDGRGDWLILAAAPSSADWTTQGVKAWKDANKTVGGEKPLYADKSTGDGYETLVFDEGKGDTPDGAWVRIDPGDPHTVDLAFKLSMLGSPDSFAMGSWAGSADSLDPSKFDFNDNMTHEQAGSPMPDYFVYPLKDLAEVDNTCKLAIGFSAAAEPVPGLCVTIAPHGPGQPTPPPFQFQPPNLTHR